MFCYVVDGLLYGFGYIGFVSYCVGLCEGCEDWVGEGLVGFGDEVLYVLCIVFGEVR